MAVTEIRISDFRVYDGSGVEIYEPTGSAPSAPTGLSIKVRGRNIILTWSGTATSFNVKRGTTAGQTPTTISTSGAVTSATYTDTVTKDIMYYYVVTGVNSSGESGNSNQVFSTTRRR